MSSFFGGAGAKAAPTNVQARKEEVKQQIQQELAVAQAQQLMTKITENCFAKCVTRPSTSLSSGEERCLTQCMELYMRAFDQISKSYVSRVTKMSRAPQS